MRDIYTNTFFDLESVPTAACVNPAFLPHLNADEVVTHHTADRPSRYLRVLHAVQSYQSGLPLFLVDMVITGVSLVLVSWWLNRLSGFGLNPGIWNQLPVLLLLQTILLSFHRLYPGVGVSPILELRGIVRSTLLSIFCVAAMNVMAGQFPRIEFWTFFFTGIVVSVVLPIVRTISRVLLSRSSWWGLRIILVGDATDCRLSEEEITRRPTLGLRVVGVVCERKQRLLGIEASRGEGEFDFDRIVDLARVHRAPSIGLVSGSSERTSRLLFKFPCVVWFSYSKARKLGVDISGIPTAFVATVNSPLLQFLPRFSKRIFDLLVCVPALVILSPLFLFLAIAIKVCSPGSVFFASKRVGQHGRLFDMWKFRTMVADSEQVLQQHLATDLELSDEWHREQKLKNDPRIIPMIGKLLRRWSLDELPQLWNVVTGDMSLVGPRPVPPGELTRYRETFYEYSQMLPGITGLWQVSGRNETSFETRVFLVHHYATNWSPWLDAWILCKTPAVVFSKQGAY